MDDIDEVDEQNEQQQENGMDVDDSSAVVQTTEATKSKIYLPGEPLKEGEELVYDPTAYVMLHEAHAGWYTKENICMVLLDVLPR